MSKHYDIKRLILVVLLILSILLIIGMMQTYMECNIDADAIVVGYKQSGKYPCIMVDIHNNIVPWQQDVNVNLEEYPIGTTVRIKTNQNYSVVTTERDIKKGIIMSIFVFNIIVIINYNIIKK